MLLRVVWEAFLTHWRLKFSPWFGTIIGEKNLHGHWQDVLQVLSSADGDE
jgi:hypothetical protein